MRPLVASMYEHRLQREIEALNVKIRDLSNERAALERQLIKARQETAGIQDVNRRNSVTRVMIERRVVEALKLKSPLSSSDLYAQAKQVTFDLKPSSFRTHLHRLKNKGIIENALVRGRWRIPTKMPPSSPTPE